MDVDRDEIAQGGEPDRGRRRGLVALAVAVCVGVVLGGLGVGAWYDRQRRADVRLHASLYTSGSGAPPGSAQTTLRLRSLDGQSVTVDTIRLQVAGVKVARISPREPRTIRPSEPIDVAFSLIINCARKPPDVATVRVRVRLPGGDRRWVEVIAPLPPSYATGNLADVHTAKCGDRRPPVNVEMHTLGVQPSDEGLALRVRVTASAYRDQLPDDLRLIAVTPAATGLQLSFEPLDGKGSVGLPVTGVLRVQIPRCEVLRDAGPAHLLTLPAQVTAEDGPVNVFGMRPDRAYARALFAYLADRCR